MARRAGEVYDEILRRIADDPSDWSLQELRLLAAGPEVAIPWIARGFDPSNDVGRAESVVSAADRSAGATEIPVQLGRTVDVLDPLLVGLLGGDSQRNTASRSGIQEAELVLSGVHGDASYVVCADEGAPVGEQLLVVMPAADAEVEEWGPQLRQVLTAMLSEYDVSPIVEIAITLLTWTPVPLHTFVKWEVYVGDYAEHPFIRITIHCDRGAPVVEREFRLNRRHDDADSE
jgi:hypothetical protein